jgi:undecaprenyl-diphosphatase
VFAIVIQMGAILAVCWLFRERLISVARGLRSDPLARRFASNLVIAFLPAAVLGVLLHSTIKTYLFSPLTVAAALVVGGAIILLVESRERKARITSIDEMTWRDALKVGFAQTAAMFPGVSRSGATIIGGMLFGLSRQTATLFSFFLAIPTMLGAAVYDAWRNWDLLAVEDLPVFAIGFAAAFLAAFFTVRGLIAYIAKHNFRPFAWYRIAFGGFVLLTWQMGWVDWPSV